MVSFPYVFPTYKNKTQQQQKTSTKQQKLSQTQTQEWHKNSFK